MILELSLLAGLTLIVSMTFKVLVKKSTCNSECCDIIIKTEPSESD